MNRKVKLWISGITAAIITVFLGCFSIIVNKMTVEQYRKVFLPIFDDVLKHLSDQEGLLMFKTLGSWFAFTVITMLILVFISNLFLRNQRYWIGAGIGYILAGLVTLLGSQLIAFVLAFPFFVTGGLCFYDYAKARKQVDLPV
ncbi:hypothetical protein KQI76_07890 [Amphibacillus sp. MSJ-3]|uniref:hypothetical protein n=1 Tax=Amphibacillus sp. MSJ-3 TaxID=2841505 RepID=UPI001C0F1F7D|nr:hypothetical protein [Amphibacillus sp. MSJ-3]MBU5595085.1 hypothetical protein [Amphibacillus sp. MSJ-3]